MAEEHKAKTVISSVHLNPNKPTIKLRSLRFSSPPLAVGGLSLSAEGSDPVSDIVLHTFP